MYTYLVFKSIVCINIVKTGGTYSNPSHNEHIALARVSNSN